MKHYKKKITNKVVPGFSMFLDGHLCKTGCYLSSFTVHFHIMWVVWGGFRAKKNPFANMEFLLWGLCFCKVNFEMKRAKTLNCDDTAAVTKHYSQNTAVYIGRENTHRCWRVRFSAGIRIHASNLFPKRSASVKFRWCHNRTTSLRSYTFVMHCS